MEERSSVDSFASFCLSGDRKKAKNNAQNWVNIIVVMVLLASPYAPHFCFMVFRVARTV